MKTRTRWICQYCACIVEYEHPPDIDFKWLDRCQEHLTERDPKKVWLWDKDHQITNTPYDDQRVRTDFSATLPRVKDK